MSTVSLILSSGIKPYILVCCLTPVQCDERLAIIKEDNWYGPVRAQCSSLNEKEKAKYRKNLLKGDR